MDAFLALSCLFNLTYLEELKEGSLTWPYRNIINIILLSDLRVILLQNQESFESNL